VGSLAGQGRETQANDAHQVVIRSSRHAATDSQPGSDLDAAAGRAR